MLLSNSTEKERVTKRQRETERETERERERTKNQVLPYVKWL